MVVLSCVQADQGEEDGVGLVEGLGEGLGVGGGDVGEGERVEEVVLGEEGRVGRG